MCVIDSPSSSNLPRNGQRERKGHVAVVTTRFPSLSVTQNCSGIVKAIAIHRGAAAGGPFGQNESEYGTELFREEFFEWLVVLVAQADHLGPVLHRAEHVRVGLEDVHGGHGQDHDDKDERRHERLDEGELFHIFRTVGRILLLDHGRVVGHAVHRQRRDGIGSIVLAVVQMRAEPVLDHVAGEAGLGRGVVERVPEIVVGQVVVAFAVGFACLLRDGLQRWQWVVSAVHG